MQDPRAQVGGTADPSAPRNGRRLRIPRHANGVGAALRPTDGKRNQGDSPRSPPFRALVQSCERHAPLPVAFARAAPGSLFTVVRLFTAALPAAPPGGLRLPAESCRPPFAVAPSSSLFSRLLVVWKEGRF